jgi:exosortase
MDGTTPARTSPLIGRVAWMATAAGFLVAYGPVLSRLVSDWWTDENYSHGFIVLPFAAWFAWERRERLRTTPVRPAATGLLVVALGLALLVAGQLGAEYFLARISIVFVLAGGVAFIAGWARLRVLALPLAFLVLMIPIPTIVFNKVAFPLQLLASRAGEVTLGVLNIPVLREGNLIILARTTLEVAEACSGIRSLVSLLTLSILYGYFTDERASVRVALALASIPIAVVANAMRVAGTGVAAHHFGEVAAEGFFHSFSGWIVFVVAAGLMVLTAQIIRFAVGLGSSPNRPAGATA